MELGAYLKPNTPKEFLGYTAMIIADGYLPIADKEMVSIIEYYKALVK